MNGHTTARPNWENRTLYHGDNLDFMRSMNSATVDLIATDPPFNKGRDFHATPESLAAGASFHDRWRWDEDVHPEWTEQMQDDWPGVWAVIDWTRLVHSDAMAAFLCFMAVRLVAMHRILRDDGSIFLHCDPTASHYLKTLMDAVFEPKQFRNEIAWCYTGPSNSKRWFPRKHDVLLAYTKTDDWTFNWKAVRVPYKKLKTGRTSGIFKQDANLDPAGKVPEDWWSDCSPVGRLKDERTGYPTQKPLALYQRIIRAASNRGGIVFDPFAGCATTPVAAEIEGRRWVACDLWTGTVDLVRKRLEQLRSREATDATGAAQGELGMQPVVLRTETLVRSDDRATAAPALRTLTRKVAPPSMKREQMVAALIAEHGIACLGCERRFDSARYLELDHRIPRSEGGSNELENRILLCGPCNRTKGNTLTLTGLRKENRRAGFMAGQDVEAKSRRRGQRSGSARVRNRLEA